MKDEIDARGLACPQPVIKTKKALEEFPAGNFRVLVDNETSANNVMRMLENRGYHATSSREGADHVIQIHEKYRESVTIHHTQEHQAGIDDRKRKTGNHVVLYLKSNQMGTGDEKLGKILIRGFLQTLKDLDSPPSKIICVNTGVYLSTENPETVEALKELEKLHVEIISCGTCLEFYNVKEKLAVGKISNMYEIADTLCKAGSVISP